MVDCQYFKRCAKLKESLDLPDRYFDERYDMCYCLRCHRRRGDDEYYTRGEPAQTYALPIGAPGHKFEFKTWHRGYHGTTKEAVPKILDYGGLALPGSVVKGKRHSSRAGHFNSWYKPDDWDETGYVRIFASPSIKYASADTYATPFQWRGQTAKVAFHILMGPKLYHSNRETVGLETQVDPAFDNSELEWSTDREDNVRIYGLLVSLNEPDPTRPKPFVVKRF